MGKAWRAVADWPRLAAIGLGAIASLAYPPYGLWALGLAALALFIAILREAPSWKAAALLGWLFGLAHLTAANNWIATAFTFQAEMPPALGYLAVPLLCLYLAVYPALAALAAKLIGRDAGPFAFAGVFAATWIVTEWLRSWVFTGYPWPPLGLMLLGDFDSPGVALLLPWLGTYALSGLAVLLAGALLALVQHGRYGAFAMLGAALSGAMLFPLGSLPQAEGKLRYALIQPLIPQQEREDPTKFEDQFLRIARLTMPGRDRERLVLWPEAAIPDYLEDGYPLRYYSARTAGADPGFARERIGTLVGPRSMLLTGLVHLDMGQRDGRTTAVSARNAVSAIDGRGRIVAGYAKAHLVPYGEYLPMREILAPIGLSRLVAGSIDYLPGPGPQTLDLGRFGHAGVQICYEIVFSGEVVDRANRPDYIFNPSNDGWFGNWGPPQHLAQARLRAIEEGLPVLRSTTTGISAVIDARGVVRQHVASGVAARLDGFVPPAHAATLFARLGNALPLGWALVVLVASLVAMRRRRV
ncbi:MAG: apolipoprotein N-acyltransferase [Erythrobacter sp.]